MLSSFPSQEALQDHHDRHKLTGQSQFDNDLFQVDDVLQMRKDKSTYFPFLNLFGPAIVGRKKWKINWRHHPFGECVTVSDEAFIIICYENFKLKWFDSYRQQSSISKVCGISVLRS